MYSYDRRTARGWSDLKALSPKFYQAPPQCYLSPRYALQRIGTEWGRHCYDNTWVDYAIRIGGTLTANKQAHYTPQRGMWLDPAVPEKVTPYKAVIISDVRFVNEIKGIRKAGGKLVRVKRPGLDSPAWQHASETEQAEIPNEEFDLIVDNDGSLEDLDQKAQDLSQKLGLA